MKGVSILHATYLAGPLQAQRPIAKVGNMWKHRLFVLQGSTLRENSSLHLPRLQQTHILLLHR